MNRFKPLRKGMTRDEVVAAVGEPDDSGGSSRKYPTPSVYLYQLPRGSVQLYFGPRKSDGLLYACRYFGMNRTEIEILPEQSQ